MVRKVVLILQIILLPVLFSCNASLINVTFSLLAGSSQDEIFDPKLGGAGNAEFTYILGGSASTTVIIEVKQGVSTVRTLFNGQQTGQPTPYSIQWDGKNSSNQFVDPGAYTIHIEAQAKTNVVLDIPVNIVRLGISEISAIDNSSNNEFPMVYYMRGASQTFTQTPGTGEFRMTASPSETSDLDLDTGTARTSPAVYTNLASYPMNGAVIESYKYNLPICYIRGSIPRFDVTLGDTATSNLPGNAQITCGYPVAGYSIRTFCKSGASDYMTNTDTDNSPGETLSFTGTSALSTYVEKDTQNLAWSWQWQKNGSLTWNDVSGAFSTNHTIYTIYDTPWFPSSGTRYSPWVRVVDDVCRWCQTYSGGTANTEADLHVAIVHGFLLDGGTNGGGDYYYDRAGGGATHYGGAFTNLSGFYRKTNGRAINCRDCAYLTNVQYNMVGCTNVVVIHLGGGMNPLYALQGIGWYPTWCDNDPATGASQKIFNTFNQHGFGWHEVCSTSTVGDPILDACMNLDEDGTPYSAPPGTSAWNDSRTWASYNSLLSAGTPVRSNYGKSTTIN